ncbi:class I adenylate cyclase [Tolumonas osonensis]|uniref:Adenylate cyclase n=1 Tax=Tolumonas osonensis TaxID=675874 RepID=A0A841GPV3_9GAMM|nr:class I adenylate cyclase [Tolumonas osonensis]MBB6056562.1 adenylate cyclase class 1 [Tolumonas osonensis]
MFKQFELLVARCDAINQIKMERALEAMNEAGRRMLSILPVLLHYHHSHLPGYVSGEVPSGIANFQPDPAQRKFLVTQCGHTAEPVVNERCISAVYTMGSTSSIGQSAGSDLDIWVCHDPALSAERLALLEQKCQLISRLAEQHSVEMNFFLIPENKFRIGNRAQVGLDNCGSAQHLLPVEREEEYDSLAAAMFSTGMISEDDWLDLGGVSRIPAEEYFGSALWLLYKGLDSPYKAVLKILVMEAYSAEFPHTELLAVQAKRWFQQHDDFGLSLDAYYLMLDKVTDYLTRLGDTKRLDLARRCFYLKICDPLSCNTPPKNGRWRRDLLVKLVRDWGWDLETLQHLDSHDQWKVEQVKIAYEELLSSLMQSYSKLIQFARRNNISESINPEDIGILSRKLYTAFEALPGKVQRINLKIAPDLRETDLSLIQVPPGHLNRQGWYLYKYSLRPHDIIGRAPLEYNGYLSKLVAWAYFNGLMVANTRVDIRPSGSDITKTCLHQFCQDLADTFPVELPPASNLALSRPCEIRHLGIFLNLERDPTADWPEEMPPVLEHGEDMLCFGVRQECLVGTVDLVYRNSWNEVRTLHFNGPDAVVEALSTILSKMHQDAAAPDAIDVFCYSQYYRDEIRHQFTELVNSCISLRLALDKQRMVKLLSVGESRYALFLERRGVSVRQLSSAIDFYRQVSDNKLERQTAEPDNGLHVPSIVDAYASEGLIQYFFEDNDNGFNVYILDENNKVEIYHEYAGSKEDLVQNVNRYYTMTHQRFDFTEQVINFNLPQFYELVSGPDALQVVPYRSAMREMPQQASG